MTANRPKPGFFISVTCPGCGGELELQEDFFSLECSHCGSALRIVMPERFPVYLMEARKKKREIRFQVDRYLKENSLPLTQSGFQLRRIYMPYWKVDAIRMKLTKTNPLLSMAGDRNRTQVIFSSGYAFTINTGPSLSSSARGEDTPKVKLTPYSATRLAGPSIHGLPPSIGLKAQYVRVVPFSVEVIDSQFEYLPVTTSWDDIQSDLAQSVATKSKLNSTGGRKVMSHLFHARGSMIYYPFFILDTNCGGQIRRLVSDGISGRVVSSNLLSLDNPVEPEASKPPTVSGQLTVEFHRCRNCGVDLPATLSCVYVCHNCQRVMSLEKNFKVENGISMAEAEKPNKDSLYPFWLFSLPAESMAKVITPPVGVDSPDKLIIPAFKTGNFEIMRRLCQRVSCAYPAMSVGPVEEYNRLFLPVTVGIEEAQAMAEIICRSKTAATKGKVGSDEINLDLRQAGLFYLPFHPQNYFMVDSITGTVTFEKNLVG